MVDKSGLHGQMQMSSASRRRVLQGLAAGAGTVLASNFVSSTLAQAQNSASGRYLFKNGVVLTFDDALGDFNRADVLVEGRKIVAVRPDITAEANVIDASNMIVMPGFVDLHHHFYQSALRNVLGNGTLQDYFRDIVLKATPAYRVEDAYIGVMSGCLRSIDAGVTHVTDLSQVSNTPEHSDAMIQAFKDSGIRAVYAYSRGETKETQYPQDAIRLQKKYFSGTDQLVTLAFAAAIQKEHFEFARQHGLRTYSHVVGTLKRSSPSVVIKLGEQGLMGPDNVYIHFTGASPAEMQRVKETGGWLSISTPIEMTMRHGVPPLQAALDAGIFPSLSSDVETTMAADMFTQMRATFTLQRVMIHDRSIKGEKNLPALLTAKDVLKMATIQGARVNGADSRTGSLTVGKDADIILLRTDRPNVMPMNNAYSAIVTGMDTSNVDTVMVAGKILKQGGALTGVDLKAHAKRLTASRDFLIEKAGWPRSVIDTTISGH